MKNSALRGLAALGFAVAMMLAAPSVGEAQASRVYSTAEVTVPPKIKSERDVASAINRSYPAALQSVGGRVQLRFVVQENGRVDASSIEVVVASSDRLAEAAIQAVRGIEFIPGQVNGTPVSSFVVFPITYAAR